MSFKNKEIAALPMVARNDREGLLHSLLKHVVRKTRVLRLCVVFIKKIKI